MPNAHTIHTHNKARRDTCNAACMYAYMYACMCVRMTCLELVFICAQGVLCVNILSWLDDVAARRFDNDPSAVVRFLIDAANAQSKVGAVYVCMFNMNT